MKEKTKNSCSSCWEFNAEDLIKEEQTVIALTHFGYIQKNANRYT